MKIIDRLKQCWNSSCGKEAIENIEDIDYTQFEDTEIFEALKPALESNWITFGPVKVKNCSTRVDCGTTFADGKTYPVICFRMEVCYDGVMDDAIIKIFPFGCTDVSCDAPYDNELKKNVSKAFAKFMAGKFGPDYVAKRSEYLRNVKDLRIKKAQENADFEKEIAEKEYKENLFDVL